MNEERIPKKVLNMKLNAKHPRWIPRSGWEWGGGGLDVTQKVGRTREEVNGNVL
jgi:hypothetical protein